MNETVKMWIEEFKSNNKTKDEEFDDVVGTIGNELLWAKGSNNPQMHYENIALLGEYLSELRKM